MQGRHSVLACWAAGRARTPQPQARRPRLRYQPHVTTDEARPANHSHAQGALPPCRADTRYSPVRPPAKLGHPSRRPDGPRSRYQPLVVTNEMRPTNHSHTQGTLPPCRADTPYSPAGPRAEPGPPRQPRFRYQPHVMTNETRSTNHSHAPGALPPCRADTRYSPVRPRAEPGHPSRRPDGPG